MKTIYMFYLVSKKMNKTKYPAIDEKNIIKDGEVFMCLYAWTTNKILRKKFKNIRNMNKFYEKIIEIDNNEFEVFANSNSDTLLEFRRLTTKDVKNGLFYINSIKVLTTCKEIECSAILNHDRFEINHHVDKFLNPDIYKSGFKKSLKKIKIINVINDIAYNDIPFDSVNVDALNVFITEFSNTYKY